MRKLRFKPNTIPLAFLLLALIAYALLIPWTGFYWDEWPFAWIAHFLGPAAFIEAFRPFRPFLGPIFMVTTSIFGSNPLGWQLFGLLIRLLTGLAGWWSFRKIWPAHQREAFYAALFLLLFPGYSQEWVALTHTNQELIPLLGFLLSLGVTALAVHAPKHAVRHTLLALFLAAWGLFTTEYFFGLETLRLFILWFLVAESETRLGRRALRTLKLWLPYLGVWIANAVFLLVYHNSPAYNSYDTNAFDLASLGPRQILTKLVEDIIQAVSLAGFSAWSRTLELFTQPLGSTTALLSIALAVVSFGLLYFYLTHLEFPRDEDSSQAATDRWAWQAVLLGLVGMVMGRLPSWAAGLPLRLEFTWDRFMLSMMLGASLYFVGLVELLIRSGRRKVLLFSLFAALAIAAQFNNANTYRRDWANQREFFWQLSWRVPALEPNTVLVTHELPFSYETDFSLSAPLNWIYAPKIDSKNLPYMFAYTKARLGSALLPKLAPDKEIEFQYRTMDFKSSTSNLLVVFQPSPGCLRVLDPVYAGKDTVPGLTYMLTDAIYLSKPERIQTGAPPPRLPETLFGKEPAHTWCYFFETAELSRQAGRWEDAARLGEEAAAAGLVPENPAEWFPFIEAFARTGNLDAARQRTQQVRDQQPDLTEGLCHLWQRVKEQPDLQAPSAEMESLLECSGLP